jgi:hypothetical protein
MTTSASHVTIRSRQPRHVKCQSRQESSLGRLTKDHHTFEVEVGEASRCCTLILQSEMTWFYIQKGHQGFDPPSHLRVGVGVGEVEAALEECNIIQTIANALFSIDR